MRLIEKVWFENHAAKWWLVPLLLPLTGLFWLLSSLRTWLFQCGIKSSIKVACPVVIVGNIGVGGNGKTPVVLYLVEQLSKRGISVGVMSRGYGGNAPEYPYQLTEHSTALEAGDEPLLIYQRCSVPVVVGADRIAAANKLIDLGCQLVISDDGLQHYRLKRDIEIAVIDGKRLFGNGLLLPAGPLRERQQRLKQCHHIIVNGGEPVINDNSSHFMTLAAQRIVNLKTGQNIELSDFIKENTRVNALAGIGDPKRFFDYLIQLGFSINKAQGFIDHQAYNAAMFDKVDSVVDNATGDHKRVIPLMMTEKDAVKCRDFAEPHWWYLPVDAQFASDNSEQMLTDICQLINK